jgi:hypothetical protein
MLNGFEQMREKRKINSESIPVRQKKQNILTENNEMKAANARNWHSTSEQFPSG